MNGLGPSLPTTANGVGGGQRPSLESEVAVGRVEGHGQLEDRNGLLLEETKDDAWQVRGDAG